mmetsp:Transcript_32732/g.52731  ORF Transcript_32732/g.52731 Transcript_32732/m.52731 type:complete len:223 (+) Transcript_32732:94-762(+)
MLGAHERCFAGPAHLDFPLFLAGTIASMCHCRATLKVDVHDLPVGVQPIRISVLRQIHGKMARKRQVWHVADPNGVVQMQGIVAIAPAVSRLCQLVHHQGRHLQVLQAGCQHEPTLAPTNDQHVGFLVCCSCPVAPVLRFGRSLVSGMPTWSPGPCGLFEALQLRHGRKQHRAAVCPVVAPVQVHSRRASGTPRADIEPARYRPAAVPDPSCCRILSFLLLC